MKMNQKGKGEDGMQTPQYLYHQLDRIFNFTCDAACTFNNCLAPKGFFFDRGLNGLTYSWEGERIFCNPPFSGKAEWIAKAHHEAQHGCPISVMVLPTNSMDSDPWHDFIHDRYFYHIIRGRVSFIDPTTGKPKTGNNSGTTVVYFMKRPVRPVKRKGV